MGVVKNLCPAYAFYGMVIDMLLKDHKVGV